MARTPKCLYPPCKRPAHTRGTKRFNVEVQKSYVSTRTGERIATIQGDIAIDADDAASAIQIVERMMTRKPGCLQTTDSRIKWDGEPPANAEYEDFTFDVTGETA